VSNKAAKPSVCLWLLRIRSFHTGTDPTLSTFSVVDHEAKENKSETVKQKTTSKQQTTNKQNVS